MPTAQATRRLLVPLGAAESLLKASPPTTGVRKLTPLQYAEREIVR